MRNRFTITISDVHGAHHYSFSQVVKKFALYFLILIFFLWGTAAFTLWFTLDKKAEIEQQHHFAVELYGQRLHKLQDSYDRMLAQKTSLEETLAEKNHKVDILDRKLQDIEELVMGTHELAPVENLGLEERLRYLQTSTFGKQLLMEMIPSGPAVSDYRGITSGYGYRKHPVSGTRKMHYGIDYKSKKGDEVIATAEGVVMFAGNTSVGFGKMVTIAHPNGFKTRYGHLSKIHVKLGEYVGKGQKIGEVGNTGVSTGAHLHYEVLFLTKRINPRPFNDWTMKDYERIFTEVKKVPWASFVQAVNQKIQQAEKQLLPPVAALTVK